MNIFKRSLKKKGKGQTMVEFALVLPLLLLVVLGLIEAGRLLFIYGSVTTASRQAVRYGSATGDNGLGTLKHLDCAGIEDAAEAMGFILPISNVDITYTRNDVIFADCDAVDNTYPSPTADIFANGDRIEVSTTANYAPMVPMGNFAAFNIVTESKRTIFIGITVIATAGPAAPAPDFTFVKSPSSPTYEKVGDDIIYTFTMENTGSFDLTVSVDDPLLGGTVCSGVSLNTGETKSCSKTYTITDADVLAKVVNNTATATATDGTDTIFRQASASVILDNIYKISLTKTPNEPVVTEERETTYTYTITNIGNQNLDSFSVSDVTSTGTNVPVTCPSGVITPDSPNNTIVCTGTYTITQADLDAGEVLNTATATASADGGANTTPEATASAQIITNPLVLTLSSTPPIGFDKDTHVNIVFSYRLDNFGTTNLSGLYIEDSIFGTITSCDNVNLSSVTLTPSASTICEIVYPITQLDMDTGYIERTATAYATGAESNPRDFRVLASTIPDLELEITTPVNESVIPVGTTTITYTYKMTNTGNVTLKDAYTIKDVDGNTLCSGTFTDLAPNAFATCTYEYTIIDPDDWDKGSITINEAKAFTEFTTSDSAKIPVTSNTEDSIVYTHDGDRMTLIITSSSGSDDVNVNDNIVFTYTLTNTGNTTLSPDSANLDYHLSNGLSYHNFAVCSVVLTDKAPGELIKECNVPYQVRLEDVVNGIQVVNTTTATAENQSGTPVTTTTSLSLNIVPIAICSSDQWTSSKYYQSPDTVYHCESSTCSEWQANQADLERGNEPGHSPPGVPPFWTKGPSCILQRSCQLSLSNVPMTDNNSYSQTMTIVNNSGVSVEMSVISLAWDFKNLTGVSLGGSNIYSGSSSANGGFSLPNPRWTIVPGNSILNLSFSHKNDWARAYLTFSDNLCSGIVVDSGN